MHLEVLIGPVASGKSTWTKSRALDGALVSNDDAWVTAVHGGNYKSYDKRLKSLYKGYENNTVNMGAALGRDVIIDRTNLTRRMRARYIHLAQSIDMPIYGIIFPIASAEVHAERRVNADGRGYDYEYWRRICQIHLKEYEAPVMSEGFNALLTIEEATEMRKAGIWVNNKVLTI